MQALPLLALTPGEPAGIGPDLCVQVAASRGFPCALVAIADPELLAQRAASLGLALKLLPYAAGTSAHARAGELQVLPVPLSTPCTPGRLDSRNAAYVLATLEAAAQLCLQGEAQALVTGPVQKSVLNEAGLPFSGHTEFLAERAGCKRVVMLLATPGLRVALATTHLPLAAVPGALTRELLTEVLEILERELRAKFGIARPRILVAGLNPHAGEGGYLGREEIEIIQPVLERLRGRGLQLRGPLPADTLFTPKHLEGADAVLAMYHDQGLPVLKYQGFGRAVNITLGLPFIRTSVDHGTALDLAGSGKADPGSLLHAIHYALDMVEAHG